MTAAVHPGSRQVTDAGSDRQVRVNALICLRDEMTGGCRMLASCPLTLAR